MSEEASSIQVEKLSIYPVKSCGGLDLQSMRLGQAGGEADLGSQVIGDREWLFVDEDGQFQTQRTLPSLSLIKTVVASGSLALEFGGQRIELNPGYDSSDRQAVAVWSASISSALVNHPKIKLLQDFLEKNVRLVHFDPDSRRMAKSSGENHGVQTRFTDAEPYLSVNQASLADLNSRLKNPVPMSRFRANIEFSGAPAFAEDDWSLLQNEKVEFKATKACSRCVMVNIDQKNRTTQVYKDPEVLKTLAQFRRKESSVNFGQYIFTDNFGEIIKVGDKFRTLES